MDIPAIVKELVFTGGSLIVPGLGRFSIIRMPAEMDISKKIVTPPFRIIQFDELKTRDDGKLTSWVADRYKLNTTDVLSTVSSWVKSVKNELSQKGSAAIEGFGTLEAGVKGITFKDDPFIFYSSLLPRIDLSGGKKAESQPSPKAPLAGAPVQLKKKRRLLVPLMILIAAAASAVYFSGIYSDILGFAGINGGSSQGSREENRIVFGKAPASEDSLQEAISRDLDESTLKENALSYREPGTKLPEKEPEVIAATATDPVTEPALNGAPDVNATELIKGYNIIAGSYLVPNNAERQRRILESKGFKSTILPPQGNYYMVSLGTFNSLEKVNQVLSSLRSELDIPLWVKRIL